ncbi:hypothetical protein DY000_02052898 [Brassica cretica]|uniref:Uncharacterized protein n=1 Tax=Brassica cretica TaxID=69181 RepID=A0ABQ7AIR8_BRACR|nr:hypothetical protein DY000_02052898 [Brassica cretica]
MMMRVGEKYSGIEFLQTLKDTGLWVPARRRPRSPLGSTPGPKGSNLNYVIKAVDEQTELPEAIQREAELQRQIDGLQGQVTELHKSREEVVENPELSSEVQSLKEKLGEHSKQLEQSAEMLSQLESENLTL